MGQITIYLDDETERLLKRSVRSSGESASKWIADAVRKRAGNEWPADLASLFGSWKDCDFPDALHGRKGLGRDVKRERL